MEERSNHLTVIIGASTLAEDLRRRLVRHRVPHAGVSSHLRGLRRSLALGENDLVIMCIALDQATLNRHGRSVRKLLADSQCFPQSIRSVGLLSEIGMTGEAAALGCDVYAHDSEEAARALRAVARKWQTRHAARARAAKPTRRPAMNRSKDAWICGSPVISKKLESVIHAGGKATLERPSQKSVWKRARLAAELIQPQRRSRTSRRKPGLD